MKKRKKIFLASSNELSHERLIIGDAFMDIMKQGEVVIQLEKWEYLEKSVLDNQKIYESHLIQSDLTFVLFWNKLGMYTEREYKLAKEVEESRGCPCYILIKETEKGRRDGPLIRFLNNIKKDNMQKDKIYSFVNDTELYNTIIKIFSKDKSIYR